MSALDTLFAAISYLGLFLGAIRVIPQTIKTMKLKQSGSLSWLFFFLQALAAAVGIAYELLSGQMSVAHLGLFAMIVLTNAAQIAIMAHLAMSGRPRGLA